MNNKTKNWIVYYIHLQFFIPLTFITIFLEVLWLFDVFNTPNSTHLPVQEVFFSLTFIIFMGFNIGMACFSMFSFIFVLHILDSNPLKTAPICPLAIDSALINIFLFHFSFYKERYFTYFTFPLSIHNYFMNSISQILEILLIFAFLAIFINLLFGIEGLIKTRNMKTNRFTDIIHIILITNGIIAVLILYNYANILTISLTRFMFSLFITLFFTGFLKFILVKKKIRYPFEAFAIWQSRKQSSKTKNID